MKRFGKLICLLLALLLSCAPMANAAYAGDSYISAQGAFVMDFETGLELYGYKADEMRVPASMTKVMSVYIVLEAISKGEIQYDTVVPISKRVYDLSRNSTYVSMVPLYYNQTYTVDELLNLVIVHSASASVVALAELVAGSEQDFLVKMNAKAKELGIDATFVCSAGIGKNYISPRGMATLARSLLQDYPGVLKRSSRKSVYFHGSTYNSTNRLLGSMYYEGADGLKTGTTAAAGYCFCGTAQRNGVRLITVVMSSSSTSQRFVDTRRLFDYGFAVRDKLVAGAELPDVVEVEPEPEYVEPFTDVLEDAWYYDSVMLMWENGIMTGTAHRLFEPDAHLTRATAATVIYRAAGQPKLDFVQVFPDVPGGKWYSNPVLWTWGAKITEGFEDRTFRPHELVTREQFVLMMYRFGALAGYDVSGRADLSGYTDAGLISDWALEAMQCAVATGLITGASEESKLEPGALLTRAQCAEILMRGAIGGLA